MNVDLNEINSRLTGLDEAAVTASLERWSVVAKPLKSLGALEDLVAQIAGVIGEARFDIGKRALVVMCADNGVIAQGVTQTDESITALVAADLAKGCSSANLMARVARVDVIPVDVGVKNPPDAPGLISRRVAAGTRDFTSGPAMTRGQALQAVGVGIETARKCREKGYRLIATGEMGIGNTTTASAVASVLLGRAPVEMTGRGAGLSDEGLRRKVAAIERAVALSRPAADDPLDVLAKVGGFDIAGMCGVFLGGAACRVPVLADGFISAVAALCAVRLCPAAAKAVLASHVSAEPAGMLLLDALRKKPLITAGMRLGEGTGAVAAMPLLDMARAVYMDCYTFEEGGIEAYTPQGGEG